jgi:hypothetical protein
MAISTYFNPLDLYALADPMPSWRWKARIIPNASEAAQKVDWTRLIFEEVNLPNGDNIPAKSTFVNGHNVYFPDFSDVPSVSVTIYEDENGSAIRELQTWRSLVKRRVGAYSVYGLPFEYKQTMLIDLYGFADNKNPVLSSQVVDLWPTDPGTWRLGYDASNRLFHQITMQCDSIITANRAGGPG